MRRQLLPLCSCSATALAESAVHGPGLLWYQPQRIDPMQCCHLLLQIRAERAPSLDMDELQQHSVKIIQHLHHEEEHPVPEQVPRHNNGVI